MTDTRKLVEELRDARKDGAGKAFYTMDDEMAAGRWLLKNAEALAEALSCPVSAAQVEAALTSWRATDEDMVDYDCLDSGSIPSIAAHIASVLAQTPKEVR